MGRLILKRLSTMPRALLLLAVAVSALTLDPSSVLAQANVVPNGNLETVSSTPSIPANWGKGRWGTNTATFTYPVTSGDGSKAAQVAITSYTSGDAKWYFFPISASAGATYTFKDQYSSTVNSYVTVEFGKSDGTKSYLDLAVLPASSAWQTVTQTFSVPAGVTSLSVFHLIKSVGTLTVDNYSLTTSGTPPPDPEKFDKGYVSLNFDDGWRNTYQNGIPILNAAGFKSDQYIVTDYVKGGFPGYVTPAMILNMQANGHVIGAHTRTHRDLTTLSTTDARTEIAGSRQDLLNFGASPVSSFAYPYGGYNNTIKQMVKDAGMIGARSSDGGFNSRTTDPYSLKRLPILSNTSFATVKSYIDQARANKTWAILLFHKVGNESGDLYTVTPAFLQQVVDYLESVGMTPITVPEGIAKM